MAEAPLPSNHSPPRARDMASSGLRVAPPMPVPMPVPMPHSMPSLKQAHMNMGTFSPVNQDGCFEFDRVIKSGQVLKRTRKTKSWAPVYLVLRPHLLSIYKDPEETRLRHQLPLHDLTATARQRDPRRKQAHVFAVFCPARTFHFAAGQDRDAGEWVAAIRAEARLDEEDEEMLMTSPGGKEDDVVLGGGRGGVGEVRLDEPLPRDHSAGGGGGAGGGYSSSEAEPLGPPSRLLVSKNGRTGSATSHPAPCLPKRVVSYAEHSGPDAGSYSDDLSDAGVVSGLTNSALSLSLHDHLHGDTVGHREVAHPAPAIYASSQPTHMRRNASEVSGVGVLQDDERVVCQGWLHFLKSTRGMRQWKKAWVVLRPKNLAFYKNEEEYSATLILPFTTIIDAVDLDPISRRHPFCMQIIAEDRNYRLCARDEDALARWLGALKSLLTKRKEASLLRNGSPKGK
ncbi:MAG: hypothetical protein M1821_000150 [Bathelium mastoideum]|nr:MAG: hypothetical protein M1821_000150 [Bathelium mastoideum]KAI9687818.1 MAG: hypothetical protein M1822_001898 [Bathelium mastoideum]